jgi:hypothetical protein
VSNRNAQFIIPFVIVVTLASSFITQPGVPALAEAAFFAAVFLAIPVMVFYLMAEEGWSTLAKRYRAGAPYAGTWRPCPTGQMALVSVDDPSYQRQKLRLVGTLRLGTSPEALRLSMLYAKIPILGRFFPDVAIPWSAVTTARTYQAPGWFGPASQPGTLLQVGYDPNYTGTFVELVVGSPPVFIELPAELLGEAMAHLPLAPTG